MFHSPNKSSSKNGKQTGNASLKGINALLLVMGLIVTVPLWFNIFHSSNESKAKVACLNLEIAKKNKVAYTQAVNQCMSGNKAGQNEGWLLSECRRLAQRRYPISQDDFPSLSPLGFGDTRAYTEARANGCGE